MATDSQITANRANAQLSTGPSSPEGKLKSSHNAVKTGLTGRTILLPTDDIAAYETFVAIFNQKFQPADDYEKHLVQTIADTEWRLLRIPTLEAGHYALGRKELAAECADESNPQVRAAMLEALISRTYKKDLNNLALQERRLRSQLEKHVAELKQLQDEREILEIPRRNEAAAAHLAGNSKEPFDPGKFGFEYSEEYLSARLEASAHLAAEDLPKWDRAWRAKMCRQVA